MSEINKDDQIDDVKRYKDLEGGDRRIMSPNDNKKSKSLGGAFRSEPRGDGYRSGEALYARFGAVRESGYYRKISRHFRAAKYVTVLLLTVVLFSSLFLRGDSITPENIGYLIRNIDEAGEGGNIIATRIVTEAGEGADFSLFRSNIVAANDGRVYLYRLSGKLLFSHEIYLSDPMVAASDKYFIVWASGEKDYYIFNSLSLVYHGKASNPIYGISVADNGSYAVLSSSSEYPSHVYLYNSDFQLTAEYKKANNVAAVSLSRDGTSLAIADFSSKQGEYETKLDLYRIGEGAPYSTHTYEGHFPLSLYDSKYGCMLLTDSVLFFYGEDGEEINRVDVGSRVAVAELSEDGAYLLFLEEHSDNAKQCVLYDNHGYRYALDFAENGADIIAFSYGYYAVVGSDIRLHNRDGYYIMLEMREGGLSDIFITDGHLILCHSSHIDIKEIIVDPELE